MRSTGIREETYTSMVLSYPFEVGREKSGLGGETGVEPRHLNDLENLKRERSRPENLKRGGEHTSRSGPR